MAANQPAATAAQDPLAAPWLVVAGQKCCTAASRGWFTDYKPFLSTVEVQCPVASSDYTYVQTLQPRLHFSQGITIIPSSPGTMRRIRVLGVGTVTLRIKKNLLNVTDGASLASYTHIVELKNVLYTPDLAYSTFGLESESRRFTLTNKPHVRAVLKEDGEPWGWAERCTETSPPGDVSVLKIVQPGEREGLWREKLPQYVGVVAWDESEKARWGAYQRV